MIVAIHQPNFLPWLGYFDKMNRSDLLILLDTVPFTKGGFQNRVQFRGRQGPLWLTIPVLTAGRLGQPTREVAIDPAGKWRTDHLKTLQANYAKAPGWRTLMPQIARLYEDPGSLLAPFATRGIMLLRDHLGIRTPVLAASGLDCRGSGSELLLNLVQAVGGTTYLSGPSGRTYLDAGLFERAGIGLAFHAFTPQAGPPGLPGLSTLDFLLMGGRAIEEA